MTPAPLVTDHADSNGVLSSAHCCGRSGSFSRRAERVHGLVGLDAQHRRGRACRRRRCLRPGSAARAGDHRELPVGGLGDGPGVPLTGAVGGRRVVGRPGPARRQRQHDRDGDRRDTAPFARSARIGPICRASPGHAQVVSAPRVTCSRGRKVHMKTMSSRFRVTLAELVEAASRLRRDARDQHSALRHRSRSGRAPPGAPARRRRIGVVVDPGPRRLGEHVGEVHGVHERVAPGPGPPVLTDPPNRVRAVPTNGRSGRRARRDRCRARRFGVDAGRGRSPGAHAAPRAARSRNRAMTSLPTSCSSAAVAVSGGGRWRGLRRQELGRERRRHRVPPQLALAHPYCGSASPRWRRTFMPSVRASTGLAPRRITASRTVLISLRLAAPRGVRRPQERRRERLVELDDLHDLAELRGRPSTPARRDGCRSVERLQLGAAWAISSRSITSPASAGAQAVAINRATLS